MNALLQGVSKIKHYFFADFALGQALQAVLQADLQSLQVFLQSLQLFLQSLQTFLQSLQSLHWLAQGLAWQSLGLQVLLFFCWGHVVLSLIHI